MKVTEAQYLESYDANQYYRFSVATDIVAFSVSEEIKTNYRKLPEKKLRILMIKRGEYPFKGEWALPGGFVRENETTEATARRELEEETGVKETYMEQLYTFSDPKRDPRTRVISTAYIALLNTNSSLKATEDAVDAAWFEVNYEQLEGKKYKLILTHEDERLGAERLEADIDGEDFSAQGIAFDHAKIIAAAIERLRGKIEYTDIALNLVPERFTLASLQQVYEIILDKKLLVANFRRKISELVEETQEYAENGGHRPSKLYKKADARNE
nr:NUDIX domain-containing protein [uncultured Cellulosilyticum sp.]